MLPIYRFSVPIAVLSIVLMIFIFKEAQNKYEKYKIESNLASLSFEEKEYLENFFKYVNSISGFGYTLIGDKPMSFETYNVKQQPKSIEGINYMDKPYILDKYRLKEGWEAWQKVSNTFPSSSFTLISYQLSHPMEDIIEIAFINNEAFLYIVNMNLEDFRNVLGKEVTAEEVLGYYQHMDLEMLQKIHNHDGLFGTLLGFGRDNSWAFMKQRNLNERSLVGFSDEHLGAIKFTFLPMFLVIPNTEESKKLQIKYYEQRDRLDTFNQENEYLIRVLQKYIE